QDATRTDSRTLAKVLRVALDAGATVVNISDTTGTATPREIASLFDSLSASLEDSREANWSLHGHNHRGRAADNALAALQRGAVQIEGTINGVGPAGGNTNLIDVAAMIKADERLQGGLEHIDLRRLRKIGSLAGLRGFLSSMARGRQAVDSPVSFRSVARSRSAPHSPACRNLRPAAWARPG
ncbi:MAG TPA: hypothetical protein VKB27_05900, partial [Gammaproteobacteria bacterium]|nr:hypothetical protein [Gammaproteobacteria bacterium]